MARPVTGRLGLSGAADLLTIQLETQLFGDDARRERRKR
jgi:hypothetical protein